jgi:DNA-binding XRE family transcriptional regulator
MMPGPIALKLRVLREERGLTHKEAAELTNVSHWTLIYLESGKRAPYMPTVTKIARAYGVPLEELVEEEPAVRFSRSLQFRAFPARPSARTSP